MKLPFYLEKKICRDKLFGIETNFDTEDQIMEGIFSLSCDLFPENLTCDGELSGSEIQNKQEQILNAWNYLENKLGRKVTENQAYEWYESQLALTRKI